MAEGALETTRVANDAPELKGIEDYSNGVRSGKLPLLTLQKPRHINRNPGNCALGHTDTTQQHVQAGIQQHALTDTKSHQLCGTEAFFRAS